jgi:hypothetical protein
MVMTIAMASGARMKASDRRPQKIVTAAATAINAPKHTGLLDVHTDPSCSGSILQAVYPPREIKGGRDAPLVPTTLEKRFIRFA